MLSVEQTFRDELRTFLYLDKLMVHSFLIRYFYSRLQTHHKALPFINTEKSQFNLSRKSTHPLRLFLSGMGELFEAQIQKFKLAN